MALNATQDAHNTAVDAAIVTWGAAMAANTAEDKILICGTDVQRGITAAAPPVFNAFARQFIIQTYAGTEAADNIWAIGGWRTAQAMGCSPLFWKFTNAAGDFTA